MLAKKKKQKCASSKIQFNSVAQSCLTLCDLMDCSMPGFPVHHQLLELAQTQVHQVSDAIQPSHLLLSVSPPAFNLSQHQGLFQWVSSSWLVAKVLELQLQHHSNEYSPLSSNIPKQEYIDWSSWEAVLGILAIPKTCWNPMKIFQSRSNTVCFF